MAVQNYTVIETKDIRTGMNIRIHQKIREKNPKGEEKERVQVFEGLVIKTHGAGLGKTMTVRKVSNGVGVEKILPYTLPAIAKVELVNKFKVKHKDIGFVRKSKKKLREIKK